MILDRFYLKPSFQAGEFLLQRRHDHETVLLQWDCYSDNSSIFLTAPILESCDLSSNVTTCVLTWRSLLWHRHLNYHLDAMMRNTNGEFIQPSSGAILQFSSQHFACFENTWDFYPHIKPAAGFIFTSHCCYPESIGGWPTANALPDKTISAGSIHFITGLFQ